MAQPIVVYLPHPGVGDLMWHLPFIRALATHRSGGTITLLTRRTTHAHRLLSAQPCIDAVEYVPYISGPLRHLRELFATLLILRRLQPRSLWILDKITRPAIAAKILGVRDVFGFGLGSQRRWVGGPKLSEGLRDSHQIEKLKTYFNLHQISIEPTEPELAIDPSLLNEQRVRFGDRPRPWIMLGVGARNQSRRWPYASYVSLIERCSGIGTWFVLGGLDEIGIVDRDIVERAKNHNVVNISQAQMTDAAALASCCDLFIGNDSGPMNVAAALGTATIGLFGVTAALTHSDHIHPLSTPPSDRRMAAITVDAVAELASRLVAFDKPPCTSL